jgi:hypothetical protein
VLHHYRHNTLICEDWRGVQECRNVSSDLIIFRRFNVMVHSSTEARWRIISNMKDAKSVHETGMQVGCSPKTVRKWWACYSKSGDVKDKFRSGRKPLLSQQAVHKALQLLLDASKNGATHVARDLVSQGMVDIVVSKATVIRAARKAAMQQGDKLTVRRGEPKKAMTQGTRQKMLRFARANKTTAWEKVLLTGRKRFYFKYPGSKVKMVKRRMGGDHEADEVFQPTNPECLNMYACISKHGMTWVHVVAGTSKHTTKYVAKKGTSARSITSAQYGDVLRKTLLPSGEKLLGQRYGGWYLQQDNDPSHACAKRVTKRWAKEKGSKVEVLPSWPPNSLALNIIENMWAWVQGEVNKLGCQNFEELHDAVVETLSKVPHSMITNLYASMKERVKLVIKREGGFTGY